MGYFIPAELKNKNNWLVWKRTIDKRTGKEKKTPYNLITNEIGGHTTKEKWTSYEKALFAVEFGVFDGLGFALSEQDNLTFIDIDNCISEYGELSELAEEVLEMFKETYIEISQSERGLHIICKGSIPAGFNNQEKGLEMYSNGRYIAITGNAWNMAEPKELQEALTLLHNKYSKGSHTEAAQKPQNCVLSDFNGTAEEVVEIILKSRQGVKFKALHEGKWQELYKSQSEADQAYINILNYFAKGNEDIIKSVFYSSKLADREKASRADYIDRTIKAAKRTASGTKSTKKKRVLTKEIEYFEPQKKKRIRVF